MFDSSFSFFLGILLLLFFAILAAGSIFPIWLVRAVLRHIRERTRPRLVAIVMLGLGFLTLLVFAALLVLDKVGISIYLGGRISEEWADILEYIFPLLLGIGCLLFAPRKLASAPTAAGGMFLVILLLTLYTAFNPYGESDLYKTSLTSPDTLSEHHEVLVVERSYLYAGRCTVYERVSPHVFRRLGEYHPRDNHPSVHEGWYIVDWQEDGFTLSFHNQTETFEYFDSVS